MVSLIAVAALAQLGSADVFVGKDKALFLAPPVAIADYVADAPVWSPDGKYVLCTTMTFSMKNLAKAIETKIAPEAEWNLLMWSVSSRKAVPVMTVKGTADKMPTLRNLVWLNGTTTAYGIYEDRNGGPSQLVRVQPGSKAVVTDLPPGGGYYDLQAAPKASLAVLTAHPPTPVKSGPQTYEIAATLLGPSGSIDSIRVEVGSNFTMWSKDGRSVAFHKGGDARLASSWVLWDAAGGMRPSPDVPDFAPEVTGDYKLDEQTVQLGQSASKTAVQTLWISLRGEVPVDTSKDLKTSALVGTDAPASNASVSPKGDAVLYVSKGVAMIRSLVEVPMELLNQAKGAAERTKALSDAKQCALALIMYAADEDERLPSQFDKVEPYLKNSEVMARFVYTIGGGNLNEIKNPATTELGYIEGPGGRAIAYADGHVKWVSN